MRLTVKETKQVNVKYLSAQCAVRYWEDATVNGVEDTDGTLIPCRFGDCWRPLIDVETGVILDWPPGTVADVHYKVCDAGVYELLDEGRSVVRKIDGYVPYAMCPGGNGYGDYVIMTIGADGKIADWRPDFAGFWPEE